MAGNGKRLPRAVREQQMLDAAVEEFATHGFHGTSMDMVAARAGVSKPMVYLYYGSKDELFAACVYREEQRFLDALSEAIAYAEGARERLRAVITAFLTYVDSNRESWRVLFEQSGLEPGFSGLITSARERLVEMTARLLASSAREQRDEEDFWLVAVALIGSGEAVAGQIVRGRVRLDQARDLLIELAWSGLAGRRDGSFADEDPT